MAAQVDRAPDARKARLAACAYAREVLSFLADPKLRAAVEAAERHADYEINKQQLKTIREMVRQHATALRDEARQLILADKSAVPDWAEGDPEHAEWHMLLGVDYLPAVQRSQIVEQLLTPTRFSASHLTQFAAAVRFLRPNADYREDAEQQQIVCRLIRDIFGNPFRPVTFAPEWRTDTATAIARQMYESREFSAMPILADALQDAGCDSDDILNHCRDPQQVHARGCWVVDLVLGKE